MLYINRIKFSIVTLYIILMSTQFIIIEGFVYSPVKVIAMLFSPIIIFVLGYHRQISKELFYAFLCIAVMTLCAMLSSSIVSWQRIGYRAMFFMMFVCVSYIIQDDCIELNQFVNLFKIIIISYGITILIQHICYLIGFREIPFFNFYGSVTMAGVFKPNGLSCEPSHSARILTILYWGYLKLLEIQRGYSIKLSEVFRIDLFTTLLFIFSMLTMGSATALIGIFLIVFYLTYKKLGFWLLIPIILLLLMNVEIDNSLVKRVQAIFNSLFSDDVAHTMIKNEGSGAVRIMPLINTLTNLDLFAGDSWIGQGSMHDMNVDFIDRVFSKTRYVGDVTDFGLFTYIIMLIFVYKCCIRRFFSMQSLLFLCLATFSVGSVYYTWLMLIVFYIVKHYSETYEIN